MSATPSPAPGGQGAARLLIVDHEPSTRQLLREFLAGAGFPSDEASDAWTALERLAGDRPAAVVLHDHVPGEQGLEILQLLRAHHPDLPVVFIAQFGGVDTRAAAARLAPTEYLPKPFRVAELLATVRRTVGIEPAASRRRRVPVRLRQRARPNRESIAREPGRRSA